jgi:hypothetical protein
LQPVHVSILVDKKLFVQVFCWQMTSTKCYQYSSNGKNTSISWLVGMPKICRIRRTMVKNLSSLHHQNKTHLQLFKSIGNYWISTSSLEPLLFCVPSIKKSLQ